MIKITIDWKDEKKFDNLIRYIDNDALYEQLKEDIRLLGKSTAEDMKNIINAERKRPGSGSHRLENAIESITTLGVYHTGLLGLGGDVFTYEVGIGEIVKLNKEAPYWEVLNDGGYIPNNGNFVPLGSFAPGEPRPSPGHFREGQWLVGDGKYTFRPKRAIEGIDYVGRSVRNLDKELRTRMEKWGSTFINGAEKVSK
jgi:hypothetical protein